MTYPSQSRKGSCWHLALPIPPPYKDTSEFPGGRKSSMIVSCPACESRFQVDREQLGYDGRIVRCGKCGNCWNQMPENDPRAAIAATAAAVAAEIGRASWRERVCQYV